ncbi:unnamed protein product, partial [Scytosiphon promiscuus]
MNQLEMAGITDSEHLVARLRRRAAKDLDRLRAKAGITSSSDLTDADMANSTRKYSPPAAIEEARLVAGA